MLEKWTDADMSKFLDIYQNYELLWNPKLELYRNNQARKSALQAIIQHMDLTEYELKNKIKNIRTTYNRELQILIIVSIRLPRENLLSLRSFNQVEST